MLLQNPIGKSTYFKQNHGLLGSNAEDEALSDTIIVGKHDGYSKEITGSSRRASLKAALGR
jgi:hypothetical protein